METKNYDKIKELVDKFFVLADKLLTPDQVWADLEVISDGKIKRKILKHRAKTHLFKKERKKENKRI